MDKIPTLFVRDPSNMSRVTRDVTDGCEWVLGGEGFPTRKWDGTNVRVWVRSGALMQVDKRRNPTREQKAAGAEPGYVVASRDDHSDQHIFAAVDATEFVGWPDGAWPCEALGPKIQGGADGVGPSLVPFSLPGWSVANWLAACPHDFDGLRDYLESVAFEGVVWHHPDGRMAKVKRRDFGLPWPVLKSPSVTR